MSSRNKKETAEERTEKTMNENAVNVAGIKTRTELEELFQASIVQFNQAYQIFMHNISMICGRALDMAGPKIHVSKAN